MTSQPTEDSKPSTWSSEAYKAAASFVPLLTTKVLTLLSPQPHDTILDIGCGDGQLTHRIASTLSSPSQLLALDASAPMIRSGQQSYPSIPFAVHDCRALPAYLAAHPHHRGAFSKAFSNAALHWILAYDDPAGFFAAVRDFLAPGGQLVFEMGGAGNVAEVHATAIAALRAHGVPQASIKAASMWRFPSEAWMRRVLEGAGFVVDLVEMEYRPTKLTVGNEEGTGGVEGWIRLMCAGYLACVVEEKRDAVVKWMAEVLEEVMDRGEEGWWIGYVRLRVVARKV